MIQRSPTYVVSGPSEDVINKFLRRILPTKITYFLIRWKNILYQSFTFFMARKYPERTKNKILDLAKNEITMLINILLLPINLGIKEYA